jgi:hypothetical protein
MKINLCDLLLLSFSAVEPTALLASPVLISSIASVIELIGCNVASGTASPLRWLVFKIPSVRKLKKQNNALHMK